MNKYGNSTENPVEALARSILPMVKHKGYGLAFIIDILSSVLVKVVYGKDIDKVTEMESRLLELAKELEFALDSDTIETLFNKSK